VLSVREAPSTLNAQLSTPELTDGD
jgi:hypothetical protein